MKRRHRIQQRRNQRHRGHVGQDREDAVGKPPIRRVRARQPQPEQHEQERHTHARGPERRIATKEGERHGQDRQQQSAPRGIPGVIERGTGDPGQDAHRKQERRLPGSPNHVHIEREHHGRQDRRRQMEAEVLTGESQREVAGCQCVHGEQHDEEEPVCSQRQVRYRPDQAEQRHERMSREEVWA